MLCAFILFLLGASQIKAYAFDNVTALETVDGGRLAGGGTPVATYDWIVSIHDISGTSPVYKAPGVAYNANWVLTTEGAVTTYLSTTNKVKLGVYVGLADANAVGTNTKHRVKDFSLTPASLTKATILHDLVALKVCPPLTTFATLRSTAAGSAAVATAASYVTFDTGVKKERTARKIGYTCQCADYTNYDANYHFCLDEEDTNYVVTGDGKAVVCLTGSDFAGFNVGTQNLGGEPYLDIYQYKTPFLSTLT